MVFSTAKVKTILIALFLILTIAITTVALPPAIAHTPPWQITTYAYITASPNPIGVNQTALVVFWLDKIFGPDIAITNNWRFHNYMLTITVPDGTNTTMTFPVVQDTTSVQTISYTPTQVGTYTFNFVFPGQNYTQYPGAYNPASILVNDTFLPSSASTILTVQQEPVPAPISSYPLPSSYWTRPIYGENSGWWSISSNWLGTGAPVLSSVGSGDITGFPQQSAINRYPGDAVGPQTAHIMWTTPIESGGVVGGNTFPIQGNTYFEGSAYNQRFTNPIIINGILYYTNPVSFTGVTAGPTSAVDIRTGKVIWSRNDVPSLSFGYVYDVEDPNQHGVFPPLLFTTNFARSFDAYTGNMMFNVSGVPSSMEAMGPQGEHLRYILTNLGNTTNPDYRLAEWNSTKIWTWTGLSPALTNASNGASWSMTGSTVSPSTNVIGTYNPGTFIVDGNVFNSSDPQNRYDWNVSIPWRNTMPSAPTLLAVFYNNMMLFRNGTYPILSDTSLTGIVSSQTPYTYFAVNLNATRSGYNIGDVLWMKTFNALPGNFTITFAGADPTVGVFTEGIKETAQWLGYSLVKGERLWGPVGNQSAWDYFGNPAFNYAASQVAYGKLYSSAYGGILYCYDLTNGKLLWTYGNGGVGNTTRSGIGVPAYGGYPTFINAVGNGVIYLVTTEHTVETPIYKGALARAVNATSGQEIWTLSSYTGEFTTMSYAIADGYSLFFNGYDDQIYSVGRGPSATTVSAPDIAVAFGTPVVIKGTVMDISAGTQQSQQAANFPYGVPCASDASMKDWMGFVYQQKPHPINFTGVPVAIDVIDSNGNLRPIGTATTDVSGTFSFVWQPDIAGNYTVLATFAGTNGYWPSYAETAFNVMQAAPTPSTTPAPVSMTDTYVLISAIAIILAIAIVGALLMMMLRKRQ